MGRQSFQRLATTPWFLISMPETRPSVLERPRLTRLIDSYVAQGPITVIDAPSGFGKTTALASWAKDRTATTAWLTVIHSHRAPAQLLAAILSSLVRLYPDNEELKAELRSLHTKEYPFHSTVETVIAAMPAGSRTTVVLDDAHESSREALTAIAVPLARYSNGRIRFIISGIKSLSRWLAKEQASGEAQCLPHSEFAFTHEEVAELAREADFDVENTHEVGRCVWDETYGWPVAVQLLLRSNYYRGANLTNLAAPDILTDYIEQDVLARLPSTLRSFVLDATATNGVSPQLVVHLTGDIHSPSLLEECRSRGLFLELLENDEGEIGMRWQAMFAQSCREIAKRMDPVRFSRNQRKVSEWLATQHPLDALVHALQADDPDFAIRMLEDLWLQTITSGHSSVLETHCLQVPTQWKEIPSLLYIRACCREIEGDSTGAQLLKARADRGLALLSGEEAERTRVTRGFAQLMLLDGQRELEDALAEAEELLELPNLSRSLFVHGTFVAGWCRLKLHHGTCRAIELLKTAEASAKKSGFDTIARRASATITSALALEGRFTEAKEILEERLTLVDRESVPWDPFDWNFSYWSSAFIAFWQGDLDTSIRLYRQLDALGVPDLSEATLARVYFTYATAFSGDSALLEEGASMLAKIGDEEQHGIPWPTYKLIGTAVVHWARGERRKAVDALSSLEFHSGASTTRVLAAAMWSRLGFPDEALATLKPVDQTGLVSYVLTSVHVTRASVAWQHGDKESAHRHLEKSLDAAESEGITAPYLYMGSAMRELMTTHAGWGTKHENFIALRIAADAARTGGDTGMSGVLSERELQVYSFLGTTMTAEEIAAALFVSPATVRSHQSSIYRKLGVTNRRAAVEIGRRLPGSTTDTKRPVS